MKNVPSPNTEIISLYYPITSIPAPLENCNEIPRAALAEENETQRERLVFPAVE